jgi:dihydroflavonol-4-reductase
MHALVTGATGFLGSHLARRLVDQGHSVRVLVRPTSDRSRLDGLAVEPAVGDVTDRVSVATAMRDIDVVFHAAAYVEMGAPDPGAMHRVNVEGTANVLGQAADDDVIAVHVSSVTALGPTGPTPVDETWWNPDEPVVAYEKTKRAAHELARSLVAEGARVRIGMPGGIYGADDDSSMAQLIRAFVSYPTPVGYMPELVQSLVNVDDCADALVAMAETGDDGDEYLLCADAVTFRQWFEAIAAGAGRRPPFTYVPTNVVRWSARPAAAVTRTLRRNPDLVVETVEMATRHQAFSGDKARRLLGWTTRPLGEGMAEMAHAIRVDNVQRRARRRAARRLSYRRR